MSHANNSANSGQTNNTTTRFLIIFTLVFAGEAIFSLPFHVQRFFRSTLLEVFDITNTQLGDMFAVYGILAAIAYFPGGPVADRFSARTLMTFSLFATALGGLVMAQSPGVLTLTLLYGYWGITTIFLFWAALIKATREWGGMLAQGRAFGLLDGGRGLVATLSATAAVAFFSWVLPARLDTATPEQMQAALQTVIYLYTGITFVAGLFTWFLLPESSPEPAPAEHSNRRFADVWAGIRAIAARPITWAIAGTVVCAYCAYKGLDNYELYAREVLGMDARESSNFVKNLSYLRVIAAITAGLIADRFSPSKTILVSLGILLISYLFMGTSDTLTQAVIYSNIIVSFAFAYGLRGVYFALLEEANTPRHLTGTTVGLVSVLGYTPDFFFYPLAGRILDASPGIEGHLNYFGLLAGLMVLGMVMILLFSWLNKRSDSNISE